MRGGEEREKSKRERLCEKRGKCKTELGEKSEREEVNYKRKERKTARLDVRKARRGGG